MADQATPTTLGTLQAWAHGRLPAHELREIIETLAGFDAAKQIAFPERLIDPEVAETIRSVIERRAAGEPLAYLLGTRAFWGQRFAVSADTLIPRPETEHLVEWALALLPEESPRCVDLGTGSGAIAVSLAMARPDGRFVAVDRSAGALRVARSNGMRLLGEAGCRSRLLFVQGSWAEAIGPATLDLVISNPPYIAADDPHLGQGDLRHEPASALVAGIDGLDDYRQLIPQAFAALRPGGWLLLEHGHEQAAAVTELMGQAGFVLLSTRADLAGHPRNTAGQRPV